MKRKRKSSGLSDKYPNKCSWIHAINHQSVSQWSDDVRRNMSCQFMLLQRIAKLWFNFHVIKWFLFFFCWDSPRTHLSSNLRCSVSGVWMQVHKPPLILVTRYMPLHNAFHTCRCSVMHACWKGHTRRINGILLSAYISTLLCTVANKDIWDVWFSNKI